MNGGIGLTAQGQLTGVTVATCKAELGSTARDAGGAPVAAVVWSTQGAHRCAQTFPTPRPRTTALTRPPPAPGSICKLGADTSDADPANWLGQCRLFKNYGGQASTRTTSCTTNMQVWTLSAECPPAAPPP